MALFNIAPSKVLLFWLAINSYILNGQSLYFPPLLGNEWETENISNLGYCQENIDSLFDYLNESNSKSFILLKNGKIVLEWYANGHSQSTLWYWASAGKTLTATLVGIAQEENHLSIYDTSATYLGQNWTSLTDLQEEKITIWNQLTMTSGLDDGVENPNCYLPECLTYLDEPGSRWAYHNGPYTLLDQVIENATGFTINNYLNQKIKLQTGITGTYLNLDENVVYFSNTRSMARFGLLMLNNGNWNGNQLVNINYFNEMVNSSQDLNPAYGYLWWLNGKEFYRVPGLQLIFLGYLNPNAPEDTYMALGKNGQLINISPSENLVWVRMGESPDNLLVPINLNNNLWQKINELTCGTTNISIISGEPDQLKIFPNPAKNSLTVKTALNIKNLQIFDSNKSLLSFENVNKNQVLLNVNNFASGMYFMRVELIDGSNYQEKLIIN